jgi:magnesium transporter
MDALIDHYYPPIERISEELDDLEETIFDDPDPRAVFRLHQAQRSITILRRTARPQLEAVFQLARTESRFIPAENQRFFNDVLDHAQQIMGRLDAAREMAVDTMSAVLATLGHRQNEVMKVLTLVGSIFIPLTFIAGIYGMNFEYMPELGSRTGYPIVISVMVLVAIGMVLLFRYKGWIGSRRRD